MNIRVWMLVILLLPNFVFAAGEKVALDKVDASLKDVTSLQNGAGIFLNYCAACHGAKFMRYNRLQRDLHIPEDVLKDNMLFGDRKIGDTITTTLAAVDGEKWFGIAPPDLSLVGRLRDADWLYTYLRSFYRDQDTLSGWNNAVFPNVAMPHALVGLQGVQQPVYETVTDANGESSQVISGFELVQAGSMSPAEFDMAMRDLTRFLVYMGEPAKLVRYNYGVWVMIFLLIFAFFAYLLKKEYWRDVHE